MKHRAPKKPYRLAAVYDTETTTIGTGKDSKAFVSLYIANDLRNRDIRKYDPDDDIIQFFRTSSEMLAFLKELIKWGTDTGCIPIVAAYNLQFDLISIMKQLADTYPMKVTAQSGTNIYTLDLLGTDSKTPILRFWDTFFLEQRGLAAMGETCGLAKATGDWDYTLVRTPETPITAQEAHYASRDVQVIPAYLRFLLESNPWMSQEDLGNKILTKTSIVRQMSKNIIAPIKIPGSKRNVGQAMSMLCSQEQPADYDTYALRHACFRGGWTFTAANTAATVMYNVASIDVTSMHHTYINGRRIPVKFSKTNRQTLQKAAENVIETPRDYILDHYDQPWICGLHVVVRFDNVRIRSGSPFAAWGIALEPESKFSKTIARKNDLYIEREGSIDDEESIRGKGYIDRAYQATFAFGKLMAAKTAIMNLTEVELWTFSRVYEYDDMTVLTGELSTNWILPPDYVTLQSNYLWAQKMAAKRINKTYRQGNPYTLPIDKSVPESIANQLRAGTVTNEFIASWYQVAVKGSFNALYGVQAQNVYRSSYYVPAGSGGKIITDPDTVATPENFSKLKSKCDKKPVLYTYGMRIVGGSRQQLAIAMELLHETLGNRITVTGGDTDSLKCSLDTSVTDDDIRGALKPLEDAIDKALDRTQARIRRIRPDIASDLKGLGHFDIENCGNATRYLQHYESWNKCRISLDTDHHVHITAAGLSRPEGSYTIEDWAEDMIRNDPEKYFAAVAETILGYNTVIAPQVSHSLMAARPEIGDTIDEPVTDYLGNTTQVTAPAVIALYQAERMIGDTTKVTNMQNYYYLTETLGRHTGDTEHVIGIDDNGPYVYWYDTVDTGHYERQYGGTV